ncbi:MAG: YncE family protein [Pseudomonadota bacterium]|nr:YncE family protein [Pseudomonadota bacterium]
MIGLLFACAQDDAWAPRTLTPYPNPFGPDDALWAPQPHRSNPQEIAVVGRRAFVSLSGSADQPDHRVAVVDLDTLAVVAHVEVGSNPIGLAVRGGEVVVFNRFSNWMSVIDAATLEVRALPTDFYAMEGAFSPDGGELWITNRWRDAVIVAEMDGDEVVREERLAVGANPRDIAFSDDGARVAVANLTGLTVSLFDAPTRNEVRRIAVGAPPNGLAFAGDWLLVATTSASTHHLPFDGPDGDGDGLPGDGTPNVNFQDMQNELVVYDAATGEQAWRYTSDSICCRDFRDVDPDDAARHGDLLPPSDTWIVGGALPEQIVVDGNDVWVGYSGSDQLQRFTLDPVTGALAPGEVRNTGLAPHGLAIDGDRVLVAHRLGETLGIYGETAVEVLVGDPGFPATDAEIGELFNSVTAPFTVDGDQACVQCHRDGGNIDKAVGMPLARHPGINRRMVMAYRGAVDTRPWFFETAMDETNFRAVINEFARVENFCCEDYTLFPDGAPADCVSNPPPECDTEPNAGSVDGFAAARGTGLEHARPTAAVTRDAFFEAAAARIIGRTTTFGDGVYYEDPVTGARAPLSLNLEGITRALGVFLLTDTQLLPNPNDPDSAAARRGRALFESTSVGCATCHPSPTFALATDTNPAGLPLQLAPVVTPDRDAAGINLDLLSDGFLATFPDTDQDTCDAVCGEGACEEDAYACDDLLDVKFGVTTLRGIWDRAPHLLHDGRANGLREVLCTPGHPALLPGETGFNERDGIPNTHGSTSQLTPAEIADLIAYQATL